MASNGTATSPPTEPPSSTPVPLPPSSTPSQPPPSTPPPPPSSSAPPPPPSSTPSASVPSTVTAPSRQPSTQIITSIVTPTPSVPGESVQPSTLIVTITTLPNGDGQPSNTASGPAPSSSTTSPAGLQNVNKAKSGGGLSTGGKTAIAVVVPVVVVGLLVLAGIILWRRRKQRKNAEEARRKEVEEYGFNPNNDPTLPAVGMTSEMAEDQSGYRGWGNTTAASSNRKASTTLASGMAYSDSTSNPGGPNSPTQAHSDNQSTDPLVHGRRETLDADTLGVLGTAVNANPNQNQAAVHRGPSNASSSYSAAAHSDNSGDYPIPTSNPQDYYDNGGYNAYSNNQYYNAYTTDQQPVIRDVSARRNTRIENPSVFPQQGNSGIAQNF
ncbi:uncharacterized protein EI97DRAFT_432168 [Westerdykella ornata]|uniref:Mid2 domain-containing protein n=1 Tax=Westerdykella ornata TaxID=318751 RepID=A0A6A6JQW2_WESOR|nr:uncharacterized protein EI97DRAFT_432168 [Westerdykella ornata]KAF2278086.1 hypothetical protein EI97DRAFT_432168 [Westerdykella ornata]